MKCYVAGKSRHWPWLAALRAAGLPLASSWLDWEHNRDSYSEPSSDDWAKHSETCLREAAECDVLILYVREDEQHFGALLETGSALAAGKQVFLISPHPWPFLRNNPLVRSFASLEAAVSSLIAMAAGERSRETMERGRRPLAVA
jgi:hypothetical protein